MINARTANRCQMDDRDVERDVTERQRRGKHRMRCGFTALRWLPISKFLPLFVLMTIAVPAVFAGEVIGAAAGSASQSQALGSVKDYVISDPYVVGENEDQVPALRIEVANGESKLTRGPSVTGIKVISVDQDGPAAIAGLQSERMIARTALTAALAVGGMVFPPAMFVAILVSQGDVGESHDLIIAVDGERTRNIIDLQDALDRAHDGEIVYLVVVRAGHRQCVAVRLSGELPPYKSD
jgi:S1-C subfamily serine protease